MRQHQRKLVFTLVGSVACAATTILAVWQEASPSPVQRVADSVKNPSAPPLRSPRLDLSKLPNARQLGNSRDQDRARMRLSGLAPSPKDRGVRRVPEFVPAVAPLPQTQRRVTVARQTTPAQIAPSAPLPKLDSDESNRPSDQPSPPGVDQPPTNSSSPGSLQPFQSAPNPPPVFGHSDVCPCGCQPRCVTQTIQVPVWRTQYVNTVQTRYRQELRQRRFKKYYTVYDDVPQVETYSVNVPQPRTRKFTVNVQQEFQERVQEKFTIMVPKPQQREVTVDREEVYKVPVETPYTVMVPEKRQYQETTYRTVTEKEPYQEKYVVNVPREKTRIETTYEREPITRTVRKPVVRIQNETLSRTRIRYRTEQRSRTITEEYYEYVTKTKNVPVQRVRMVPKQEIKTEPRVVYNNQEGSFDVFEYAQRSKAFDKEIEYTNYVLQADTAGETYYVNEPYEEEVTRTFPIKTQMPRNVTKTYRVKIPETSHVPQQFTVKVPYEVMETRYRTVTRQVPVTRYRTITRDMGHWERQQVTCPTCQLIEDGCGCTSCASGMQTTYRNVWCPRIVTQRIPYTDYREVQQQLPYQVPQLRQRVETRTRQVPVTRYRTEIRNATLKVYDLRDSTRTETFKITKYRWVAKTRPITVKRVVQEPAKRLVPFIEYEAYRVPKTVKYNYRVPSTINRQYTETSMVSQTYQDFETVEYKVPEVRERTRTESFTVRVPYEVTETYQKQVPVTDFKEVQETSYVEVPKVKTVTFTEMVPEIRTRTKFRDIKKRVPVFTTKTRTEMVPQIRTRTSFRTETRTVSDKVMKTYMIAIPEVRTRTVYKTRYRDVPQVRTEVYWVDVPETRYRTKLVRMPRQVAREHVQTYTVSIPYQVNVSVPVQVCSMVSRTVTVPAEPCCESCHARFHQLHQATGAYLRYGAQCAGDQLQSTWQRNWWFWGRRN